MIQKLPDEFEKRYKSEVLKELIADIGMWTLIPCVNGDIDTPDGIPRLWEGNKIYYKMGNGKKKVMKLNGKSKKKTSTLPKMTIKKSNTEGYSVLLTSDDDEINAFTYLITPAGQYLLGSHEVEPW